MQKELFSLVYFSRNTIERVGGHVPTEIAKILTVARERNSECEVTGALPFSGNWFAQVLEGPHDAVQATFERIRLDPRHTDIMVLHCIPIAERSFGNWSMACAEPAGWLPASLELAGILGDPSCIDCGHLGNDVVTVLRLLIAGSEMTSGGDLSRKQSPLPSGAQSN